MFFHQILDPDLGCACYVLGCGGQAVVVDPGLRTDAILAAASRESATITTIVETHTHADHVSGRGELVERTGAAVRLPAGCGADDGAGTPLAPGDVIEAGKVRIEALAAPGHRPEHLAFLVTDTGRSDEPQALLSGDSLLVGDLARPDLAVDAAEGAADLHATLQRIAALPDHVELWPGHIGGSLCGGAGLSPKPSSTLGFERRAQALLAVEDVEAFTATLTASLPQRPPTVERVVARNRSAYPSRRQNGRFGRPVVVDGRTADQFDLEHIKGAVSLPLGGKGIGTRAGWVIDQDSAVIATAGTAEDAEELSRRLRAVGIAVADATPWSALRAQTVAPLRRKLGVPVGAGEPSPFGAAKAIDVLRLPEVLADYLVVDVRDEGEWAGGHLDDSIHLPLARLRDGAGSIPREKPLAVACAVGGRAAFAASWLRRSGHDAARVSGGGIPDLRGLGVALVA